MDSLIRLLFCLLFFTFISGCPAKYDYQSRPQWANSALIPSLDKQEVQQVFRKLGKPAKHLTHDNKQYLIYTHYSAEAWIGAIWPVPVPFGGKHSEGYLDCLKVEINSEGFVEHVKENGRRWLKEFSVSGLLEKSWIPSLTCMGLFWDVDELERILSRSQQYSPEQLFEFYRQFERIKRINHRVSFLVLCLSANQGYQEANLAFGTIYEMGYFFAPIKIHRNYIKAYVRYAQSNMDEQELQRFVDKRLNPESYLKAQQALDEWKPGQCAAELGLMTTDYESERYELLRQEEELRQQMEYLLQANQGNADVQLAVFKEFHREKPSDTLILLCRSADSGNQEARVILAEIYERGGYPWFNKGIVERNDKLAYVWLARSGKYDQELLQSFADNFLTSEERLDAEKMLEEWQPGNCEKELGLNGGEPSNIN